MKLLKLTIHNLASIVDAEIDFQAAPLADSTLFLITGKTGAGKSTILDAICLALYNKTPRMDGTLMDGDVVDIAGAAQTTTVKDVRQLMRRNTGEAWVLLSFEGGDGRRYEARWSVARARQKASGRLQDVQWTLTDMQSGHSLRKKTETRDAISDIVGLDFTQFCRTTMLAQGEFTKFLNSKDDEKSAILEKIIGVDNYTKIGAKIYQLTKEKETAFKRAAERLTDVVILTAEQVAGKEAERLTLEATLTQVKAAGDKAKAKRQWLIDNLRLEKEKAAAAEALSQAKRGVECDEFKHDADLARDWQATIDVRNQLSRRNEAIAEQQTQREAIKALEGDFKTTLEGLRWLNDELARRQSELDATMKALESLEPKKEVLTNAQTIVSKLEGYVTCNDKIAEQEGLIERMQSELSSKLNPSKRQADKSLEIKKKAHEEARSELATAETRLNELSPAKIRREKDLATQQLSDLQTAQQRVNTLAETTKTVKLRLSELEKLRQDIDDDEKALQKQERDIQKVKAVYEAKRDAYEKQRENAAEWAKNIRSKLAVGDVCPVCQQVIAELPIEEAIRESFIHVEREFQAAQTAFEQATQARDSAMAQLTARRNDVLPLAQKNLELANTAHEDAEKQVIESCEKCGVELPSPNLADEVASRIAACEQQVAVIAERIKAVETIERRVKEQRVAVDKAREALDDAQKVCDNAEKKISQADADIRACDSVVKAKTSEREQIARDLDSLLASHDAWRDDWQGQPKMVAQTISDEAADYTAKTALQHTKTTAIRDVKSSLRAVNEAIDGILDIMPDWRDITVDDAMEHEDLLRFANQLRTEAKAASVKLSEACMAERDTSHSVSEFLKENPGVSKESLQSLMVYSATQIETLRKKQQTLQNLVTQHKTRLEIVEKNLSTHLAAKPEITEQETDEVLEHVIGECDEQIREIGEAIGAIRQQLETDAQNKQRQRELIIQCDAAKEELQRWERVNALVGDASGKKFRTIALSYILENLIHSANAYMRTLTNRYTLKVQPGTFVISIEDAYQGYVSRAANTISGGESFLVSLALALALSDIANCLRVSTLFIDEGFGTLSGEPLQMAIDTLRSLHNATGRQVGIISHVEELRERIPVQIKVEQEGNASNSTIRVVG